MRAPSQRWDCAKFLVIGFVTSSNRFNLFLVATIMKRAFVLWLTLIGRFCSEVESIHLSCLFQSTEKSSSLSVWLTTFASFRWLGPLYYIRLWHDNTGRGDTGSWFLKYVIVRDLQTMEKYYFICQRWFAVEKDDGVVRIIIDSLFNFLQWLPFLWTGRTSATGGKRKGDTTVFLCSIQTSLSQFVWRAPLVFDLLSTAIGSLHSCSTMYLLFRLAIHRYAS